MSKFKVRNKLLSILALPFIFFIILSALYIIRLSENVQTINWNIQTRDDISLFQHLNTAIQAESLKSMTYLIKEEEGNSKDLQQVRSVLDKNILEFKDKTNSSNKILAAASPIRNNILKMLNTLSAIRQEIDNNSLTANEVTQYFEGIQEEIFSAIKELGEQFKAHILFSKSNASYLHLLEEAFSYQKLNLFVETALKDNTISIKNLEQLITLSTEEQIFDELFEYSASPKQKRIYSELMSNPFVEKAEEIIKTIIKNNIEGDYDLSTKTWRTANTHLCTGQKII